MKKLNIFLLIVLLILIGLTAWFLIGGTLSASVYSVTAPASDHPEAFASIQNILRSGSAPQQFAEVPADASGCTLVDTTITLRNRGLFPAEWLDAAVTAASGDIAVYSLTGEGSSVPTGGPSQLNLKLITTAPADVVRSITIRYYVFGMLRSITVKA